MLWIANILLGFIFVVLAVYYVYFTPPWNFPSTIPTIPFYVSFLPFFTKCDQERIYATYLQKPMEKHGAVKIYFGGRWNILLSHPKYLATIFKKEQTYAKSGNHLKVSKSVIAAYTGENVISAHGKIWKVFRNTMTLGLTQYDEEIFFTNAKLFSNMIESKLTEKEIIKPSMHSTSTLSTSTEEETAVQNKLIRKELKRTTNNDSSKTLAELQGDSKQIKRQSGTVAMTDPIQRLALANISEAALGLDFGTLRDGDPELHLQLKLVKSQIFQPLYLTFPFLDNLPIPSRVRARRNVARFRETLLAKVTNSLMNNYEYEQTNFASSSLIKAERNQQITKEQLINNLVIILVAGHENPQLLLTSLFFLFGKHPCWQEKIRKEVQESDKSFNSIDKLPFLTSFIYEAIRMYPPLSQIINRCTVKKTALDQNIVVPKGAYVGYNVYGTGRNGNFWERPAVFDPYRWGHSIDEITDNWRHCKQNCTMAAFHGGNRACLGEKLALAEVKITFVEMLSKFEWKISPNWRERMTPAGPLCPAGLELCFQTIESL
ncbi:hypothetical protein ACO0QE_001484 [Hanseniaspora vineae]